MFVNTQSRSVVEHVILLGCTVIALCRESRALEHRDIATLPAGRQTETDTVGHSTALPLARSHSNVSLYF